MFNRSRNVTNFFATHGVIDWRGRKDILKNLSRIRILSKTSFKCYIYKLNLDGIFGRFSVPFDAFMSPNECVKVISKLVRKIISFNDPKRSV